MPPFKDDKAAIDLRYTSWIPEFISISALALISTGVQLGIENGIFLPYIGRVLGVEILGAFVLARYWLMIPVCFVTSAISNAYLRHKRDLLKEEERQHLFSGLFYPGLLIIILAVLILTIMAWINPSDFLDEITRKILQALSFYGVLYYFFFVALAFLRGELQLTRVYALRILLGLLLLMVIPFSRIFGDFAVVIAPIGSLLLVFTLQLAMFPPRIFMPIRVELSRLRFLIFEGAMLGLPAVLIHVSQGIDKVLVGYVLGSSQVGLYFALTTIPKFLLLSSEAVAGSLLPYLVDHRKEQGRKPYWKWVWFIALSTAAVGIAVSAISGRFLTDFLYGQGTFDAGTSIFWLSLLAFVGGLPGILFRPYLVAYHRPSALAIISLLSMVTTFIVGLMLVDQLHLVGVILGRIIGEWLRGVMTVAVAARGGLSESAP